MHFNLRKSTEASSLVSEPAWKEDSATRSGPCALCGHRLEWFGFDPAGRECSGMSRKIGFHELWQLQSLFSKIPRNLLVTACSAKQGNRLKDFGLTNVGEAKILFTFEQGFLALLSDV